ncbi:MAG: chemotaxis protein CheB [Erythrobacter sp.]|uniref:chemotaxis protein CheB n=1 Tax=Erythrobacter sp. TaxID=1042 RepID=UPI0032ECB4C4
MPNTRVMVVDDSAAMRALFCDILDNAKGVDVCAVARSAEDARDQMDEARPDVLTLDVEMPGMSGMEFLEEIMATRPMPVIMLSSITQAGTGTAQRALELGAVHCFPKPLHTSREEFNATVEKLGEIVLKAHSGELSGGAADTGESADGGGYESDGSVVAIGCGTAGIDAAKRLLAAYPANCPPTVLVIDAEADTVESAVSAMRSSLACEIANVVDGMSLKPGTAFLAYDRSRHVIVEQGETPVLRLVERDPVAGFRPSADLLLGSLARSGIPVVGGLLPGTGTDGAKGLQILGAAKGRIFVQEPADYAPRERYEAVRALGLDIAELKQDALAGWVLDATAAKPEAA